MNKINILHIQVLPIMSGVQKAMLDILERLDRNKCHITILCNAEGELTEAATKLNINFIILPELRREINPLFDIIAVIKLIKLIKKNRFQLVHTHSSKSGFVGRLAASAAGVKCIVHTVQGFAFHEYSSKLAIFVFGLMERIAGVFSDKIIFVNQYDKITASKMRLASAEKMITIPNGIDFVELSSRSRSSANTKKSIGIEASDAVVGMVARLWEQKSPQDFIRSVPTVVKEFSAAKFLVIGDGHLKGELQQLSIELGISENVLFLGWRNDVRELLKILDVFVLPSLWEGLSVSILEAMASGKPVVASNIKGNNELVVDGATGYLVEPRNPEQIGEKVLTLLKNRTLAEKMGLNGYKRVKENFNIHDTVCKINQLYDTLLVDKV
ncbi:glycosyltransferase family 4 protein [candidate division KSB1 bacterium]|nr:glycosyltransferase family 4 protein [candidate division KSB1 bacterium]